MTWYRPQLDEETRIALGTTAVERWVAVGATLVFLATIATGLAGQLAPGEGRPDGNGAQVPPAPWRDLGRAVEASLAELPAPLAANRTLLGGLRAFEDALEEAAWQRRRLVPRLQRLLTAAAGAGNEQVLVGRDGWLFYQADLDHVLGPAFLDPSVAARRRLAGDPLAPPPGSDPLSALERTAEILGRRGIELVVFPTPLKPSVHPEKLAGGGWTAPPVNPSTPVLAARLAAAGVAVFDPTAELFDLARGEAAYLEHDTHWSPAGLDLVATRLAERVREIGALAPGGERYRLRPVAVEGRGDLARLLALPVDATLFPPQTVVVELVLAADGRPVRPRPGTEVLLLGDSFTNVYSDPALGWGSGAGLAEQLSHRLGRPVDRIARNAGGAGAVRRELEAALVREPERFRATRVAVYQFAARDLSAGDWIEIAARR